MREENAMRALRVLGLAEDGENLVCEDGTSGELFTLPADERLRAATRGDLSRLGQLQIELEPQLRPREIQARIRAGATIAQVATADNTSAGRIERYAYPVLLERSTTAEKARLAHPMVDGNPTRKNLEELVLATLADRGQDGNVQWDAYRDDDGWVVVVRWQAGRSENSAHWQIHAGQRTTTLHPKDDAARELMDPSRRPLRTIAAAALAGMPPAEPPARGGDAALGPAEPLAGPGAAIGSTLAGSFEEATSSRVVPTAASRHPAGSRRALADRLDEEHMVEQTVLDDRADYQPPAPAKTQTARTGTDHVTGRGQRKGQRPVMPGWEDVLLGGGQTPNA
jgi:hypothetical protein